jgi:hypothetical protein
MKAIKIDVEQKKVYHIEISDWREIAPAIGNGCQLFACPITFENNDTLYTDDEGLLKPEMIGCFYMPEWDYPLVGNAIILGSDEEGESIDALSTCEEIENQIMWGTITDANDWREKALSTPPQIYFSK